MTFGHNPYPDNSAEPPWTQHQDDPLTVGGGDLPRLLSALDDAFAGTGQPLPGSGRTSIWYLENGFQTTVPAGKLLAACRPEVGAYFNFELVDEQQLAGWQSGVLWRDGTCKASYPALKQAIALVQSGEIDCSTVPGAGGPIPQRLPDAGTGQPG